MKTERRHDLETNELARRATVWIEKVKPYSTLLVGVAVVLLGVWVVSSVWGSITASEDEAAWDAYGLAITTSDLEMQNMQRLANDDQYKGTTMQEWAFAAWADRQLYLATRLYLTDRTDAQDRLRRIVGVYEQLAINAGDEQLRNRARFGLARVYELQDKLEKAGELYDQVQGDLQPLARLYADRLLTPEARETYAWLNTAKLPRRNLEGAPGTPGSRPDFDVELPNATTDPSEVNLKTLEDILGFPSDASADDRYDSKAEPVTDAEKNDDETDDSADLGDDTLADETPAAAPAPEDANQP
jgi:hypothetical protein